MDLDLQCESDNDDLFEQDLKEGEQAIAELDKAKNTSKSNEKSHVCTHDGCNAKFNRPYRLKLHLLTHHIGQKPFECHYEGCGKSYTNNHHLQRHITATHDPPEFKTLFKCTFPGCGASVRHESNLRRHYIRAHEPRQFKHKCTVCPMSFCREYQLRTHEMQHSGEAPFRCEECGLGFARKRLYEKHKRCHQTYQCQVPGCSFADFIFNKYLDFVKHHHAEHPPVFICDFCGHEFVMKARIREHMCQHLDKSAKEVFVCPYEDCSRFYCHKKNLQTHIRVKHEGMRWPCPHEGCSQTLSCRSKLRLHMKIHEPGYTSGRTYVKGSARRRRKDYGIPHRSFAVKLAGVCVPYDFEKALMDRPPSPYNSSVFTNNLSEEDVKKQ